MPDKKKAAKKVFTMTLSPEQYDALKTMAAVDGAPMSVAVRQLVLATLRERGFLNDTKDVS